MAEDSASAEDSPGWGWQDCYDRQKEWLDEALQHVPWPDETIIPSWEAPLPALREALQRITGSLTYLNANQGLLRGRSKALKDVFESAMSAAKGRIPANEKLTTEAAREGWVFNSDIGEALRDTRRRYIEIETCIISQDGLIRAYQAAWDGVSRMLSASLGEVELATSRTA
jgi:hypothetical protein